MRELTANEIRLVAGGTDECTADEAGNNYAGVSDPTTVGEDLIEIYEGLVEATSHIIERVAEAL